MIRGRNPDNARIVNYRSYTSRFTSAARTAAAGDLNGDGKADVVIGYVTAPGAVFFNDGSGRSFEQVRFGDGKGAVYGITLGDLNGDVYPDIVAARSDAPNVVCFNGK